MTFAMHRVLIAADESAAQDTLRDLFEVNGFRVFLSSQARLCGNDALLHRSDVVMLDTALPEGLAVIQAVRARSEVPLIVLSAPAAEAHRIAAFEAGADDIVLQPFSAPELMARVGAVLRRHARGALPMGLLQLGGVCIDLGRRSARRSDGREVRLTPLEHRILAALVRHGGRAVSHSALYKEVWGPHRDGSQELRVYIGALRRKLEEHPARPRYIVTDAGMGYRLVLDVADPRKPPPGRPARTRSP